MLTRTRLQTSLILAAGALLGYAAAVGKLPVGCQANAAPGNELPAAAAGQDASLVAAQASEQKEPIVFTVYMLASSLIEEGMNWWQAVLTIVLGNLIVLVPLVLNAHVGTRYGIPFPV